MQARLNYPALAPEPLRRQMAMEGYLAQSDLDPTIKHLVKIRASQVNGCAYCIDMHTKDARAEGETEQRIYALNAWSETPFYSEKERAALAWTETVTHISGGVSEEAFDEIREHFDEKELVDLTWAIASINAWNRLAISFRSVPGDYKPLSAKKMLASAN